jgi:hypothetical protein
MSMRRIIRSIMITIAALGGGSILGLILGAILGAVLGGGISLFFEQILLSHQTVLMSILISFCVGGLLGLFALLINNKLFDARDHPLVGITAGAVIGVVVMVFFYGYLDVSNIPIPYPYVRGSHYFIFPPFTYSVSLGSRIGATIFPLFGATALVREENRTYREIKKNQESENDPSFYRGKNSVTDK